ncbi:C-type lectin domain family 4 member F-like [Rhea pennata]|uniref:C-type lectin domain family 4 member F-like n=1 Tax=Rhea pennata TaxID=8795 RepID=UPI002E26C728
MEGADVYENMDVKQGFHMGEDARAERELRAERAAAANASHEPPRGCAAPGGAASCRERLEQLAQRLSEDWRYHNGNIYYFSREPKPWQDAEDFCVSEQSHLTSITSPEQQEYLTKQVGGDAYWIGLTDLGIEGTWRWVDGTEYKPGVSFWAPGQPDNWEEASEGREDCAHLQPEDSNQWNDKGCSSPLRWICQKGMDAAGL